MVEDKFVEGYEETYKKSFEEKDSEEKDSEEKDSEEDKGKNNIIKIAGRPIEVYILTIVKKLQTNDQIEIHCLDTYRDRALRVVEMFAALGILPVTGKIEFRMTRDEIVSRRTGRKFKQPVNKITLTKIPELYRFTNN